MITIREYKRPESLEEAWQLNQKRSSCILGGMHWLKMRKGNVQTAIDLSLLGLNEIEETEDEFHIGAMVTLRELETHPGLHAYTGGAMKEALRSIVGVQFRNTATAGGSVFGRYGFSDVLTMFMAMDSYVELYQGGRIPMTEFAAMKYDRDILTRIIVKKEKAHFYYSSVRKTKTDFPVLTCGARKREDGTCIFAVGARPGKAVLLKDEEKLLHSDSDGRCDKQSLEAFAAYAQKKIITGTNMRGSADYRRHLTGVLIKRTLTALQNT